MPFLILTHIPIRILGIGGADRGLAGTTARRRTTRTSPAISSRATRLLRCARTATATDVDRRAAPRTERSAAEHR